MTLSQLMETGCQNTYNIVAKTITPHQYNNHFPTLGDEILVRKTTRWYKMISDYMEGGGAE